MKRIFVIDDERHVIDWISLIVKWELAEEFEIVGSSSSGQEAIEKAPTINPDIVLMKALMPGVSGLNPIREIRKCWDSSVFILTTAHERFDVVREALELGVVDYLLKPVMKDRLILSLCAAADFIDRQDELAKQEMEYHAKEMRMRLFVESAFLHGIMLGEHFGSNLDRYRVALGIEEALAVVAAVAVLPPHGSPDPDAEAQILHEKFRTTVRCKTNAFAGPLVANYSLVLLPLVDEISGRDAVENLRSVIAQSHADAMVKGYLRLGFGSPKLLSKAGASWSEALGNLLGSRRTTDTGWSGDSAPSFENDESFLEGLTEGTPERARFSLEQLLEPFRGRHEIPLSVRYRIVSLFGSAYRRMTRRGVVECADVLSMMDFEDLRMAASGAAFDLAVRARFSKLMDLMERTPRWSPPVSRAIAFVKENYGDQIGLEQTAYAVGISRNHLSRLFCEETGKGFSDFLIDYRIEKAKELLLASGTSIKHVSMSCGYSDPNYFSRLFKKVTGLTPTAFSSDGKEVNIGRPEVSEKTLAKWSSPHPPQACFRYPDGDQRNRFRGIS